jgi:hypothetical protein
LDEPLALHAAIASAAMSGPASFSIAFTNAPFCAKSVWDDAFRSRRDRRLLSDSRARLRARLVADAERGGVIGIQYVKNL